MELGVHIKFERESDNGFNSLFNESKVTFSFFSHFFQVRHILGLASIFWIVVYICVCPLFFKYNMIIIINSGKAYQIFFSVCFLCFCVCTCVHVLLRLYSRYWIVQTSLSSIELWYLAQRWDHLRNSSRLDIWRCTHAMYYYLNI